MKPKGRNVALYHWCELSRESLSKKDFIFDWYVPILKNILIIFAEIDLHFK